jgi:hypothetical protein
VGTGVVPWGRESLFFMSMMTFTMMRRTAHAVENATPAVWNDVGHADSRGEGVMDGAKGGGEWVSE